MEEDSPASDEVLSFGDALSRTAASREGHPEISLLAVFAEPVSPAPVVSESNDVIYGDDGDDIIQAGIGNDVVFGGNGMDAINGGAGVDFIEGQDGNDRLAGGAGVDVIFGGAGDDQLGGGRSNDYLIGGAGKDELDGNVGDDWLFGDATNRSREYYRVQGTIGASAKLGVASHRERFVAKADPRANCIIRKLEQNTNAFDGKPISAF